jgi:hypothetical protein
VSTSSRRYGILLCSLTVFVGGGTSAADEARSVDTQTLHHKVLCGYQGWFRCPDDSARQGWRHWSRDSRKISPETVTFEMWPDLNEFDDDEKYPAPGFSYPDDKPAHLFSSVHLKTVDRHFRWMQEHSIDGAFLQRFLVEAHNPASDQVLENVRQSANKTGRAFGLCYDLSGADKETIYDLLVSDWKRLVDEKQITRDNRYLHHNGKPVLFIWGFFSDRFGPELANRIIDFFKSDPKYGVTLVGGCQWWWRTEKDLEWNKVFRRFDIISPWNVGNSTVINGQKHAATNYWKEDPAAATEAEMEYLPVIYPGFGWTNLQGQGAAKNNLSRLGGEFYWRQFHTAADLGIEMAYVAMFDEVDEATAIFKVSNTPPQPGHFVTYEDLPTDWYLRLTGEGTKLIRGERKNTTSIPIEP